MSLLALFFSTQGKGGQCKKWEDSYNKLVHLEGIVTYNVKDTFFSVRIIGLFTEAEKWNEQLLSIQSYEVAPIAF